MSTTRTGLTLEEAHTQGVALVQRHTQRFADYLRSLDDEQRDRSVPGMDWSAGQVMAHVQSVYERYTVDPRRAATPEAVAAQNAEDVTRLPVDVEAATSSMLAQVDLLAGVVAQIEPDRQFPFHAGEQITMAGGWGNLLGELLAHGHDIAAATGRPFTIPGDDLEMLWRFTSPALGGWLRTELGDLDEAWVLAFPFGGLWLRIADGALTVESLADDERDGGPASSLPPAPTVRRVDVGDVTAFTLQFPYRRARIDDPLVALLATRFRDL